MPRNVIECPQMTSVVQYSILKVAIVKVENIKYLIMYFKNSFCSIFAICTILFENRPP